MMLMSYLLKKIKNIGFFSHDTVVRQMRDHPPPPILSDIPDTPESFGYKVAWLAIKIDYIDNVVAAFESLNFSNQQVANWRTGIEAAYYYNKNIKHNHLFISPPLDGWVFVVGAAFDNFWCNSDPLEYEKSMKKFMHFVQTLKQHHILNFYYFSSYRVSSCYCWAIIEDSNVKRIYVELDGNKPYEQGKVTSEEWALGYRPYSDREAYEAYEVDEVDEVDEAAAFWFSDEHTVMELAAAWSIKTDTLEESYPERLGVGVVLTRLQTT
jgi:hypothetical protein